MTDYIKAELSFSANEMLTSLMLYGYYCYHDNLLMSILPNNLLWEEEQPEFYVAKNNHVTEQVIKIQQDTFKDFYKLKPIHAGISHGIDLYTGTWHTDKIEKIDMQIICYQADFGLEDGGELGIRCYDGVTRFYTPNNGDVIVLNHAVGVEHKVFPIKSNKNRSIIVVAYVFDH